MEHPWFINNNRVVPTWTGFPAGLRCPNRYATVRAAWNNDGVHTPYSSAWYVKVRPAGVGPLVGTVRVLLVITVLYRSVLASLQA